MLIFQYGRYTSELTIDIAYGMDKLTADDRYHRIAQDAVDAIAHGSSLFAALVDFFPIRTCTRQAASQVQLNTFHVRSEIHPCMGPWLRLQFLCNKSEKCGLSDDK